MSFGLPELVLLVVVAVIAGFVFLVWQGQKR